MIFLKILLMTKHYWLTSQIIQIFFVFHAESREHLKNLLSGRKANGIIFTTMQKFEESDEPLSERRNIVVMVDILIMFAGFMIAVHAIEAVDKGQIPDSINEGLVIMSISIVLKLAVSSYLMRVDKKTDSQAL